MSNIKPCPFCGGDGELVKVSRGYDMGHLKDAFRCGCWNCNIYSAQYQSDIYQDDDGDVITVKNGASLAIEAWNTRSDD